MNRENGAGRLEGLGDSPDGSSAQRDRQDWTCFDARRCRDADEALKRCTIKRGIEQCCGSRKGQSRSHPGRKECCTHDRSSHSFRPIELCFAEMLDSLMSGNYEESFFDRCDRDSKLADCSTDSSASPPLKRSRGLSMLANRSRGPSFLTRDPVVLLRNQSWSGRFTKGAIQAPLNHQKSRREGTLQPAETSVTSKIHSPD